jgi:uncharacterized protein DUF3489
MFREVNSRALSFALAVPSAFPALDLQRFQISLDVPSDQSDECRHAVTTAKGKMKLMTTQKQDQSTTASEPAGSGKARAPARKPSAAIKSTRKPGPGKKAPKRQPKAKAARRGQGSKSAHVIALLEKSKGATLAELMKATGWPAHSVRGFLSGTLRKKMGLKVESAKPDDGERVYSIPR